MQRKIIVLIFTIGLSLFNANAQELKPELIVQTAHASPVNVVAYSPNGQFIASGDQNGVVKLWESETGLELRTFYGHEGTITSIVFSPDGKRIATANDEPLKSAIIVWDAMNGQELFRETDIFGGVSAMTYRPDGALLSLDVLDDEIIVWNVTEKKEILKTAKDEEKQIDNAVFSADGKLFAFVEDEKIISLRDTATGKELQRLSKHQNKIEVIAFSPNSHYLVSTSEDGTVKLWEVTAGKELKTFDVPKDSINQSDAMTAASFSPDNSKIVVGGSENIIVWDTLTGKQLQAIKLSNDVYVRSVAFSPDQNRVAGGVSASRIKIWDAKTGELKNEIPQTLRQSYKGERYISFNSDGNFLITHAVGYKVNIWNIKSGLPESSIEIAKWSGDKSAVFSSDDKMIAVSDLQAIKLINKETGQLLRKIETGANKHLAFSPDSKLIAGIGPIKTPNGKELNAITLYDVVTGSEVLTIPDVAHEFVFSPDGKFIAARKQIWDAKTGTEIKSLVTGRFSVRASIFSPDGKTLATGDIENIKFWDTTTWTEKSAIRLQDSGCDSLAYSPDGSLIVCTEKDTNGGIKVWNIAMQKEMFKVEGHAGGADKVVFNPNGKFFVSIGTDTNIKFWNAENGKLLANLIEFPDGGWITTDANGLFDGTSRELKQLFWRLSPQISDVVPLEAFFKEFYRPGLLQEIMQGKIPTPPNKDLSKIDIRQPQIEITAIDGKPTGSANLSADKQSVKVRVEIEDNVNKGRNDSSQATSGANDLRLFRNGALVHLWKKQQGAASSETSSVFELKKEDGCTQIEATKDSPRKAVCETDVAISSGENNFTAYAFNHDNVKSSDATALVKGEFPKKDGTLYVLAVGVNKYANTDYNLRFAVPDVLDIESAFKEQQGKLSQDAKLKQYAHTEVVSLTDEIATKTLILTALNKFSKNPANQAIPDNLCADLSTEKCDALKTELAKIKPTAPEDALVIYYAGHGTSRDRRFYILPHNFTGKNGTNSLKEQAISDLELNEMLENVDAGKLLMVIDACQSGQALGEKTEGKGPMNSKGLAQLAYDKGMLILTAAQSQQAALEAVRIGGKEVNHGLLTYALLEALKSGQADKDADKQIREREWFDYAVEQVPLLQMEAMRQRRIDLQTGKESKERGDLIFLDGDDPSADPEKRRVQTPRVFYRREAETIPFIVAKN